MSAITISPVKVDKYVTERLKSIKRITVRSEIESIVSVLNHAVSRGRITHNPIAGYKKPPGDGERINPPSIDELNSLIQHAPTHLQRVIMICAFTGLRPGESELFRLKYKDIDLQKRVIVIQSARKKGLAYREIPIHESFRRALVEWIKVDGVKS